MDPARVTGTPQFPHRPKLLERNRAATERDCPECTMNIPVDARRCPQRTAATVPALLA